MKNSNNSKFNNNMNIIKQQNQQSRQSIQSPFNVILNTENQGSNQPNFYNYPTYNSILMDDDNPINLSRTDTKRSISSNCKGNVVYNNRFTKPPQKRENNYNQQIKTNNQQQFQNINNPIHNNNNITNNNPQVNIIPTWDFTVSNSNNNNISSNVNNPSNNDNRNNTNTDDIDFNELLNNSKKPSMINQHSHNNNQLNKKDEPFEGFY